jgi:hypothetical protein
VRFAHLETSKKRAQIVASLKKAEKCHAGYGWVTCRRRIFFGGIMKYIGVYEESVVD